MAEELIQEERRGRVVVLRFNDPERLNAMTEAMGRALSAKVGELSGAAGVRAVVLTGAGRAFSAGGDLAMIEKLAREGRESPGGAVRERNRGFMEGFYRLYLAVRDLPCPSVAALNGAAIGAGLCVALACDLRVAARDAKLGLNFTRLGIHPGMGATWTLPRLVGPARAADLLLTGRVVEGEEAAAMGLVNQAVDRERVLPHALDLAEQIAAAAPLAVRGARQALARSLHADLGDQLGFEAEQQSLCYESDDLAEGLAAAREKRSPNFEG